MLGLLIAAIIIIVMCVGLDVFLHFRPLRRADEKTKKYRYTKF